MGGTEGDLAGGLEIAVIDDEIVGIIKHIVAGCKVSEETLAFDVMQVVIPRDGVFLGERHTAQQIRRYAFWTPLASERKSASSDGPAVGMLTRARDRATEILKTHQVEPLPDDVSRHLDEIAARPRRELMSS